MEANLSERIASAMASGTPWMLPLALVAGLSTSLNPCAFPMIGAVAGYLWTQGGRSRWRSALVAAGFLAGLTLVYVALGVAGSLAGSALGLSRGTWSLLLAIVCLAAGLLAADLLPVELPAFSPLMRFWGRLSGIPGAVVLGVLLGLVATPCATPPLVAILSFAAAPGATGYAAALLA